MQTPLHKDQFVINNALTKRNLLFISILSILLMSPSHRRLSSTQWPALKVCTRWEMETIPVSYGGNMEGSTYLTSYWLIRYFLNWTHLSVYWLLKLVHWTDILLIMIKMILISIRKGFDTIKYYWIIPKTIILIILFLRYLFSQCQPQSDLWPAATEQLGFITFTG